MRIDVVNELEGIIIKEKLPKSAYLQKEIYRRKVEESNKMFYSERNKPNFHLIKTKNERRLRYRLHNSKFAKLVKKEQTFDYKKLNLSGELEYTDEVVFPFSDIIEYGQNSIVFEKPTIVKETRYFHRSNAKRKKRVIYKVEEPVIIEKPEQSTEPVLMWDIKAEILHKLLDSEKEGKELLFSNYVVLKEHLDPLVSEGFASEEKDGVISITENGKRKFAEYLHKWWQSIPTSYRDVYESKLAADYLKMAKCGPEKCVLETKKVLKKRLSRREFEKLLKDYKSLKNKEFKNSRKKEEAKKDLISSYGIPSHLMKKIKDKLEYNTKTRIRFLTNQNKRKVKRHKPLCKRNKDKLFFSQEKQMIEFVKKIEPSQLKYFIGKPMYRTWLTEDFLKEYIPEKFEELQFQRQIESSK